MTVYVVCDQRELDTTKGELRNKFDFSPAQEFGELVFILPPSASPFFLENQLSLMHKVLANFGDEDYLLLVGNPILLGLSVTIAAHYNSGNVKLLQWSGARKCYIPVQAREIFDPPEGDCRARD